MACGFGVHNGHSVRNGGIGRTSRPIERVLVQRDVVALAGSVGRVFSVTQPGGNPFILSGKRSARGQRPSGLPPWRDEHPGGSPCSRKRSPNAWQTVPSAHPRNRSLP